MSPEDAQARLVAAFEARDLDAFVDVYENGVVRSQPDRRWLIALDDPLSGT